MSVKNTNWARLKQLQEDAAARLAGEAEALSSGELRQCVLALREELKVDPSVVDHKPLLDYALWATRDPVHLLFEAALGLREDQRELERDIAWIDYQAHMRQNWRKEVEVAPGGPLKGGTQEETAGEVRQDT